MPRIPLRNTKMHYQQTGSGPDVVLVHGLSCNIAFWWFHVAQHLAQTCRVTAVDLRGHGFSGMTETGYRAVDLAADLAALFDSLNMKATHVVAHSFGGAVAVALATERPDLVDGLTLADAWIPSLQPVPPLPGGSDWAATRARAHARGIEIDPQLPLVVRGLYAELLDEIDFIDEGHDEHHLHAGDAHWEHDHPEIEDLQPNSNPALDSWRESRFGRGLWKAAGAADNRPGMPEAPRPWAFRSSRFAGRNAGQAPRGKAPRAGRAPADPPRPPVDEAAREARRQALEGALMMTGAPGTPSQGVRRWQDLMHKTHARGEFLDATAIEPPALRGITAEVLLVYGARSNYRPTADALQALLPGSRLRIVPRAAHYFPLLRPQALLRALEETTEPVPAASPEPRKPRLRLVASNPETPLPAPTVGEEAEAVPSSLSKTPHG